MTAHHSDSQNATLNSTERRSWWTRNWLTARLSLIVIFGFILTAAISLWASIPIVKSLAGLSSDSHQLETISETRLQLVELYKLRRIAIETQIRGCLDRKNMARCHVLILGDEVQSTSDGASSSAQTPPSESSILWSSESDLQVFDGKSWFKFHFNFKPIQPLAEEIATWLSAHEHFGLISDDLTRSFIMTMVATATAGVVMCLLLVLFLSKSLREQYRTFVAYIRGLASGVTQPIPMALQNKGELSGLAREVHGLSVELAEAQKRVVDAERMTVWQTVARKVAHEIKNPLTPIGLVGEQLHLLASRVADPQIRNALTESGRIIAEETTSLNRMVKEFTAFGRLPSPKLQEVDLNGIIQDFVDRNGLQNSNQLVKHLHFSATTSTALSRVDPAMIHQILHNLLNNARLAKIPEPVSLDICLSQSDDFWLIDVIDDGPGVPPEIRDRMFDAYVTTRSTGEKEKGMGLGLTISKQIATDHGGTLELFKTDSTGTTMRIRLPIAGSPSMVAV